MDKDEGLLVVYCCTDDSLSSGSFWTSNSAHFSWALSFFGGFINSSCILLVTKKQEHLFGFKINNLKNNAECFDIYSTFLHRD